MVSKIPLDSHDLLEGHKNNRPFDGVLQKPFPPDARDGQHYLLRVRATRLHRGHAPHGRRLLLGSYQEPFDEHTLEMDIHDVTYYMYTASESVPLRQGTERNIPASEPPAPDNNVRNQYLLRRPSILRQHPSLRRSASAARWWADRVPILDKVQRWVRSTLARPTSPIAGIQAGEDRFQRLSRDSGIQAFEVRGPPLRGVWWRYAIEEECIVNVEETATFNVVQWRAALAALRRMKSLHPAATSAAASAAAAASPS